MRQIEVPDYIKGLIFDCDGTLVDSMPLHMEAWKHAIAYKGGAWDLEFFVSQKGMPEEDIVHLYNSRFGTAFNPSGTVEIKHRFFRARSRQFKPIPHVVRVVMEQQGLRPMAVASGGVRANVELELDALHIKSFFRVILTADDDIKPKPAPDIFLEAARRLGIEPEHCQVFEDGDLGLEAARIAGMLATDVR